MIHDIMEHDFMQWHPLLTGITRHHGAWLYAVTLSIDRYYTTSWSMTICSDTLHWPVLHDIMEHDYMQLHPPLTGITRHHWAWLYAVTPSIDRYYTTSWSMTICSDTLHWPVLHDIMEHDYMQWHPPLTGITRHHGAWLYAVTPSIDRYYTTSWSMTICSDTLHWPVLHDIMEHDYMQWHPPLTGITRHHGAWLLVYAVTPSIDIMEHDYMQWHPPLTGITRHHGAWLYAVTPSIDIMEHDYMQWHPPLTGITLARDLVTEQKYRKRLLLRCLHHLKSDIINSMNHMRISGTEPSSIILSQTK